MKLTSMDLWYLLHGWAFLFYMKSGFYSAFHCVGIFPWFWLFLLPPIYKILRRYLLSHFRKWKHLLFLRNLILNVFQLKLTANFLNNIANIVTLVALSVIFICVEVEEGLPSFKILMNCYDIWCQYSPIVFFALIFNFPLVVMEDLADAMIAWLGWVASRKQILINL